jgi:serine O-acetyltransferase
MSDSNRSAQIRALTEKVVGTYTSLGGINRIGEKNLPSQSRIVAILEELLALIFPGYHGEPVPRDVDLELLVGSRLDLVHRHLCEVIENTLKFCCHGGCSCMALWDDICDKEGEEPLRAVTRKVAMEYLEQLPAIRELLDKDVEAAYEGDPAATNMEEIILCYPGVQAIAVHRLAHPLYKLGVPLLPRIMTEWAHRHTGVDIHPGATIGPWFFIDHGTGVVIGETCDIGEHVKIYQSVTLGALSFSRKADGSLVKGGKRHPTIGDRVTIYANATILGGDTDIGAGAVIGGGTWVTHSVAPGAKVTSS